MQRARQIGELAVRGRRDGLAAGVHQLAAQLLVEVGDLRDVLEPANTLGHQLLRIESGAATSEKGRHREGEPPLFGATEHVATGDRGGKSDLGRVLHQSFPSESDPSPHRCVGVYMLK